MRENGVSEVLGYMYIFGIVMAVLAIVFVQVNTMVEDMKRSVMSQSLEQSFKRIQYIIHSVSFGEVPSQAVEIEMQGGTLWVDRTNPEFILAFVNYTEANPNDLECGDIPNSIAGCINLSTGDIYISPSCPASNYNFSACLLNKTVGKLVFSYKDWLLTIEAGSIFSKYSSQDYSKLLYEPRILYNTTLTQGTTFLVMNIPVVEGNLSLAGTGRFRFFVNEGGSIFSRIYVPGVRYNFSDVYLIIRDTQNGYAWCKFFENSEGYFNVTLDSSKTQHSSCYYSENPTVTVENEIFSQRMSEIIVIFREVVFS
ncbi:MAG: hypothetical protein H0Z19_02010 [Archaeoglobus sp.]|uniref:DUF7289 family protein n=1 Tax=Archaeoglobus sp. TaxID=1872626 RepID=UPI001D4B19E9|nr:hypothetical protein [Archaeoglobus sp.]MBO8179248.1 hypothetical protein [Archaeoglobus sp.]